MASQAATHVHAKKSKRAGKNRTMKNLAENKPAKAAEGQGVKVARKCVYATMNIITDLLKTKLRDEEGNDALLLGAEHHHRQSEMVIAPPVPPLPLPMLNTNAVQSMDAVMTEHRTRTLDCMKKFDELYDQLLDIPRQSHVKRRKTLQELTEAKLGFEHEVMTEHSNFKNEMHVLRMSHNIPKLAETNHNNDDDGATAQSVDYVQSVDSMQDSYMLQNNDTPCTSITEELLMEGSTSMQQNVLLSSIESKEPHDDDTDNKIVIGDDFDLSPATMRLMQNIDENGFAV
jgi:hypothetical protein